MFTRLAHPGRDERCECEMPGSFCSGVPGILGLMENEAAPDATVERCDLCRRFEIDEAAAGKSGAGGLADPLPADARSFTVHVLAGCGEVPRHRRHDARGGGPPCAGPLRLGLSSALRRVR